MMHDTIVLLQVPIMLRSDYCSLHDQDDVQLSDLGECPYDQVCNNIISHLSYTNAKLHICCGSDICRASSKLIIQHSCTSPGL